jgi:hypothetical protein
VTDVTGLEFNQAIETMVVFVALGAHGVYRRQSSALEVVTDAG